MSGSKTTGRDQRPSDFEYKPGKATVAVIGLGYVGLPLITEFAAAGFRSIGIDIDQAKVDSIAAGESYIPDVLTEQLGPLVRAGTLVRKMHCPEVQVLLLSGYMALRFVEHLLLSHRLCRHVNHLP